MKKATLLVFVIFMILAGTVMLAVTQSKPSSTGEISLLEPKNNSVLTSGTTEYVFKWIPVEAVTKYNLLIQVQDGALWKEYRKYLQLTGVNQRVKIDKEKKYRWNVTSIDAKGHFWKSPVWNFTCRLKPSTNGDNPQRSFR